MMGTGSTLRLFLAAGLALLAWTVPARAQSGEVTGRVIDAQGQPLQGVTIRLLEAGEKESREQASGADGSFRFAGLATKIYIVNAAQEGYAPVTCPGFRLLPGLPKSFEIQLMPAEGESGQPSTCKAAEPAPAPPGRAEPGAALRPPLRSAARSRDPR